MKPRNLSRSVAALVALLLPGTAVQAVENGDFETGLTGWTVVESGGTATPGQVVADVGQALFLEGDSFLVTLEQAFVIPRGPQELRFDVVVQPGFDLADAFHPDAFEVSLLNPSSDSIVPVWRTGQTSFFNLQEDGTVHQAAVVGFDGTTVSLDISSVPPGTHAALYFDLIGGDSDAGSGIRIDNVVLQSSPPAGDVPDLLLAKTAGEEIVLTWGTSCLPTDDNYGVYEGFLNDFTSHEWVACDTGGQTSALVLPAEGATYYLVVPSNGSNEGSYGTNSAGEERPGAFSPCFSKVIGSCGAIPAAEVFYNWADEPSPICLFSQGPEPWTLNGDEILTPDHGSKISDFALAGDGSFSGRFRTPSNDDDAFGIVFGYQDIDNHYRFAWDQFDTGTGQPDNCAGSNGVNNAQSTANNGVHGLRLIRAVGGEQTFLYQDPPPDGAVPWADDTEYAFSISRLGDVISLSIDDVVSGANVLTVSVTDDTFLDGHVGIWSSSQPSVSFFDLSVSPAP